MTKELVIQGSANRISGFVLERITIRGSANRIEIVAPVGVKVEEYGSANKIQIQRLSTEDFANALMNKIKMNPLKIITSDIITISGPSGAGKSAIARGLKKKIGRSARVVP